MRRNVQVKINDYEHYIIPLSLSNLLPKSKEKYIWSELEKRHPCFSNDFCYFVKDKISKRGLISDVYVMEKSILGNYKKKYGNSRLYIEGKNICNKILKRNKIVLIVIFFILFLICIYSVLRINTKSDLKELDKSIQNSNSKNISKSYGEYDKSYTSLLFNTIRKNNGKINNFFWNIGVGGELISGVVDNVFPEQLQLVIGTVQIKNTNYMEGKPYFNFSVENNFSINYSEKYELSIKSRENIRAFLSANNIRLVEEQISPFKIVFFLDDLDTELQNKENILSRFSDLLEKELINIYSCNLSIVDITSEKLGLKVSLSLNNNPAFRNNQLKLISKNLDLFILKNKSKTVITQNEENRILGEVNYKSGRKIIFFKNNLGKIEKKEVN